MTNRGIEGLGTVRVTVDQEGIRFGKNCWFSHDHIIRDVGLVAQTQYQKWVTDSLAAVPEPKGAE